MRKIVILLALAGVAVAGVIYLPKQFEGEKTTEFDSSSLFAVKKGDFKITITEKGTLKTKKAEKIRAKIRGSAKIAWLVDEGAKVKKGDKLVELDKTQAQQQLDTLENSVIQLQAQLKAATTDKLIQEGQNKTNVEKAELTLETARITLKKLLEGDIPKTERQHRLSIEKAESDLKRAEERFADMPELLKQDFVTKDQFENDRIAVETAKATLETARLDSALYQKYQKPLDLKQKKAAVVEAERALERTKKQGEAQLAAKTAAVMQRTANLKRTTQNRDKQKDTLSKMELKAPRDGIVLYGDPDQPWMAQNVKIGQNVWPNFTIITLPDPSEMAVIIQIHEADIAKIKKKMKAVVISETQKDRTLDGTVVKIDAVANAGNRWGGNNIKKFKVEIAIEGKDLDLKPGTSASVELQVGEVKDALFIPLQAVHAKEGQFFCWVVNGSKTKKVSVKLGRSNESYIEITEGLEEGQKVLLRKPDANEKSEDDTSEKSAPKKDAPTKP